LIQHTRIISFRFHKNVPMVPFSKSHAKSGPTTYLCSCPGVAQRPIQYEDDAEGAAEWFRLVTATAFRRRVDTVFVCDEFGELLCALFYPERAENEPWERLPPPSA